MSEGLFGAMKQTVLAAKWFQQIAPSLVWETRFTETQALIDNVAILVRGLTLLTGQPCPFELISVVSTHHLKLMMSSSTLSSCVEKIILPINVGSNRKMHEKLLVHQKRIAIRSDQWNTENLLVVLQ